MIDSKVIAAKSDFASARAVDPVNGELQAFEIVGEKMGDFLESTIKRYWQPQEKQAAPAMQGESPKVVPTPPPNLQHRFQKAGTHGGFMRTPL